MIFWIKLYIKSSLHVSFAMLFFVLVTYHNFSAVQDVNYISVVFLGTLISYNFLKYYHLLFKVKHQKNSIKFILIITSIALVIVPFFCATLPRKQVVALFLALVLVFLYPKIRKYGFIKIVWLCFVVTWITVYVPMLGYKTDFSQLSMVLIQRFLFVFLLMIPFEINDLEQDKHFINTMPLILGIPATKILSVLLSALLVLSNILFYFCGYCNYKQLLSNIVIVVFVVFFTLNFKTKYNFYALYFLLEALPILWYFMLSI